METHIEAGVVVGDRIRISVALIAQLAELPNHESVVVTLISVLVDDDGVKILTVATK